mgnify:CR=1 FL=1
MQPVVEELISYSSIPIIVNANAELPKITDGKTVYEVGRTCSALSNQISADLKKRGIWFVCADMGGTTMYQLDLKGPIGLVIGNEGEGVSRLVRDRSDFIVSIPMYGHVNSLNVSTASAVIINEAKRGQMSKK